MDRREDLVRFYAALGSLEKALGGVRVLAQCSGRSGWPRRGVYFFFEGGEERSDTGQGPRIVRVGTHAVRTGGKAKLWRRLSAHRGTVKTGGGNHRGSVFRLLVGAALAGADPALAAVSWDNDGEFDEAAIAAEKSLEQRVSTVIRAMPFLWLAIDDEPGPQSRRAFVERNAIALLSSHGRAPVDPSSAGWLGRHCAHPLISSSGLWNRDFVDQTHDPAFLDEFEAHVAAVRS
jgi:hypothetical protein